MFLRLVQGSYITGSGGGGSTYATANFTPDTTSRFVNPEAGPYGWVYTNSNSGRGGTWLQNFTLSALNSLRSATVPRTLVLGFIDGTTNVTSNFSTAQINQMRTALGYVRAAGMKVILMLCYNFSSNGADATAAQIDAHLSQLEQTFFDYADIIHGVKMGGLGDFAEFHDGTTGGAQNQATKLAVMQSHMAHFPDEVPIMSRYVADTSTWFPNVITQAQFLAGLTNPTIQTRLGAYDDGYLAGPSNSGTFDGRPGTSTSLNSITTRQNYLKAQTLFTMNGGEVTTFAGSPFRTSYADATGDGAAYHMGFLNFEPSSGPQFFNDWAANGADQQIAKYYGYRIQLDSLTYPTSSTARGQPALMSVVLRNNGYSRIHHLRNLRLELQHVSSGEIYVGNADDLRKLDPVATSGTQFDASVSIPANATPGNYRVFVSAPDSHPVIASDTRQALRFANANSGGQQWEASTARFNTNVTIPVV